MNALVRARAHLAAAKAPVRPSVRPSSSFRFRPLPRAVAAGVGALLVAATAPAVATEPVVVTATRTPQRVDQTLAQVTVIERARIEAAAGRTLADLLSEESGVQTWSTGGLGKPASLSIRGLESRHTLLLVDGVRYGSATVGTPTWDNLPLEAIERIEIVRGPLSGLYGSDAVGGVIQVFTRRGVQGTLPDASVSLGSRRYAEAAAGLRFGQGALDGSLRVQQRRTDGRSATNERVPFGNFNADDDGFEQHSLSARVGTRFSLPAGEWRAELSTLRAVGETQLDDGPTADARAELRTEVTSAQLSGPLTAGWKTTLRLARSVDDYDTLRTASAFTALGNIGTTQQQLTWENQLATPIGTALVLAERIEQQVERPGAPFDVSQRTLNAVALGLNGEAGAHGWQASVRRDRNSQFGGQTTGSLAWGVQLTPGLRATASTGRSFTAPSFNQLYFPNFGNRNLLPETGRHHELGLAWRVGTVRSRLVLFDHRIRGYISSGPQPANIPRVKVSGASLNVDATLGAWTLAGGIDSQQPINATAGTANFGRILPRRAQDMGRLSVDWRGGTLALGGTLRATGERFDNVANTTRLAGYATLDLRAEWKPAPDWTLAARLDNALDQRYETVLGYNPPGREAFLTLRWTPR